MARCSAGAFAHHGDLLRVSVEGLGIVEDPFVGCDRIVMRCRERMLGAWR